MATLLDQYYLDQFKVREEDGSITFGKISVSSDGTLKFIPNTTEPLEKSDRTSQSGGAGA